MDIPKLESLVSFHQDGKNYLLQFNVNKGIYETVACGEYVRQFGSLIMFYHQGMAYPVFTDCRPNGVCYRVVATFRGISEKDIIWAWGYKFVFKEDERFYCFDREKKLKDLGKFASSTHWLITKEDNVSCVTDEGFFHDFGNKAYRLDSDGELWIGDDKELKSYRLKKREM